MPNGNAAIIIISFEELHTLLNLPSSTCITHVQNRALAPELFIRVDGPNLPPIPNEKGGRIELRDLKDLVEAS